MSITFTIIALVIVILFAIFFIGAGLYIKFGIFKSFYHDIMEWHRPREDEADHFNGVAFTNHCKYCGKRIMEDSQGNWFSVED